MNTFNCQLSRGHKAEEWSLKVLLDTFPGLKRLELTDKDGDLITEQGEKIEVKYDRKSDDTGNVALEMSNLNNHSGLSISKSTYYFIVCKGKDFYEYKWIGCLVPTKLLLSIANNYMSVRGGDDNKITMVILPVTELIEHSIKIIPVVL